MMEQNDFMWAARADEKGIDFEHPSVNFKRFLHSM